MRAADDDCDASAFSDTEKVLASVGLGNRWSTEIRSMSHAVKDTARCTPTVVLLLSSSDASAVGTQVSKGATRPHATKLVCACTESATLTVTFLPSKDERTSINSASGGQDHQDGHLIVPPAITHHGKFDGIRIRLAGHSRQVQPRAARQHIRRVEHAPVGGVLGVGSLHVKRHVALPIDIVRGVAETCGLAQRDNNLLGDDLEMGEAHGRDAAIVAVEQAQRREREVGRERWIEPSPQQDGLVGQLRRRAAADEVLEGCAVDGAGGACARRIGGAHGKRAIDLGFIRGAARGVRAVVSKPGGRREGGGVTAGKRREGDVAEDDRGRGQAEEGAVAGVLAEFCVGDDEQLNLV
eukprot:5444304-Prymnesium_polylepis.1